MSQVIFQKITFRNLLSYGNYDTTFDYTQHNNTLIASKNGAGKSALALDSLCYGLFNKPYRDIKLSMLINSINNKALLVTVHFSVGNDQFKVVRGQKPAVFEIWKNDELIEEDSNSRSYQALLETILGFNYKTFKQIVVIGAANYVPFMQLDAKDRRSVIEDILDISIFSEMSALATKQVSELKSQISQVDYEIQLTKDQIQSTGKTVSAMEVDAQELEAIRQEKLTVANKRLAQLEIEESKLQQMLELLTQKPLSVDEYRKALNKAMSKITEAEVTKRTAKKTLTFFGEHDECPSCNQVIGNEIKQRVSDSETSTIEQSDDIIQKFGEVRDQLEKKVSAVEQVLQKINELNSELMLNRSHVQNVKQTIMGLEADVGKTINTTGLRETKDQLANLMESLTQKQDTKTTLVEDGAYASMAVQMLKDNGIKSRIIAQYIPLMNQYINEYLAQFDMFVDFNLDENFNETIRSRHRDSFTYNSFSEGEKKRIDMSILFSWRRIAMAKNSLSTNLIIFDETMDSSLDEESVDVFTQILESLEAGMNVIVVSHRNVVPEMFDRVIQIKKNKDFQEISEV